MVEIQRCPFSNAFKVLNELDIVENARANFNAEEITLLDESSSGTKVWLVTRYDVAKKLVKDPRLSVELVHANPDWVDLKSNGLISRYIHLLSTEPANGHNKLRKFVSKKFTPRAVLKHQSMMIDVAKHLLDKISSLGHVDLLQGFALPFSLLTGAHLLGVSDHDIHDLFNLIRTLSDPDTDSSIRQTSIKAIDNYILSLLDRERSKDNTVFSLLVTGFDEGVLSHSEFVGMCFLALFTGIEVSINMITSVFRFVLENSEIRDMLCCTTPTQSIIDELLRLASPVKLLIPRYATTSISFGNIEIRRGDVIFIHILAANHDEKYFKNSKKFDVSEGSHNKHLSFGGGPHHCLGKYFALMQLKVALKEFLHRFPETLLLDTECQLSWSSSMHFQKIKPVPVWLGKKESPISVTIA